MNSGTDFIHIGASAACAATCAFDVGIGVVDIVLGGAERDGPAGLSFIEAAGGVGIVLDPDGAHDESRSSGAMQEDHPDHCSVLDKMAALLVALAAVEFPPSRLL